MLYWKVLFVKPRTEKKVTEYCAIYSIPYYLPLREKSHRVQRRLVTVDIPVFPGYVFVKLDPLRRLDILKTNLVSKVLEPENTRKMLKDLVMVRRALQINPSLQTTAPLAEGRKVRIVSGAFMGVEGRVARLAKQTKVILNIELIGQAIAVEVDRLEIETMD
jgi:transcription antitermination factor NusG